MEAQISLEIWRMGTVASTEAQKYVPSEDPAVISDKAPLLLRTSIHTIPPLSHNTTVSHEMKVKLAKHSAPVLIFCPVA